MNIKQGRTGAAEMMCLAVITICALALFSAGQGEMYRYGSAAFIVVPLGVGFGAAYFAFAAHAMRRCGADDLWALMRTGLGDILGTAVGALTALLLALAAGRIAAQFAQMLAQYVFKQADVLLVLAYVLLPVFVLCWRGQECLARTARLLAIPLAAALVAALAYALFSACASLLGAANPTGSYDIERLAPIPLHPRLLGEGFNEQTPAAFGFAALLVCAGGYYPKSGGFRRGGLRAGAVAAGICLIVFLLLGTAFTYKELSNMRFPMYMLASNAGVGGAGLSLNEALLSVWTAGGMLAAGALSGAGARLWCGAFGMRDIRPPVFAMCSLAAVFAACIVVEGRLTEELTAILDKYASPAIAACLLVPSALALVRTSAREKKNEKG